MTVSTTIIKSSHNGNGSTTTFAYSFKIFADTDLVVIIRSSTGTETTKSLSTHYTVSGAGDASGGSITFTSGNTPASGETVVIRRNVPQTQAIDYIANDPFPAETNEEGLDRSTMIAQQVSEATDRSIKLSRTNTMTSTEFTVGATDRANKILAFDSSGEISVTQELGTFKGSDATVTTAAYVQRDIIKSTTTAELNNVYICVADSVVGDSLTDTDHFALLVDAVSSATSATASASSATASANSATASANSATASANSATAASTSETNAGNSATAAASSATSAAASFDSFDDRYLGAKSSDPSTDNDGNALLTGALYFNSTDNVMKNYTGSAWQTLKPTSSEQTNINAVAADATDIGAVAGKATEIGRLGTSDAVADMAILGTTDVVADMNTLGTSDIVTDMNLLATSANVTAMGHLGTSANVTAMGLLGTSTNVTNMATVSANIVDVNTFAVRYRIGSSNPTSSLDAGDLFFNTSDSTLKVYNGSAWVTIQADTDVKVSVSSNDTTPGFLNGKLVAGTGVSLTEGNDGGDETLTIASSGASAGFAVAMAIAL
jgi:hypothetical protein